MLIFFKVQFHIIDHTTVKYCNHVSITTHNELKKTKARFGRLLRPLAWKQNGLFWKEKIDKSGSKQVRK